MCSNYKQHESKAAGKAIAAHNQAGHSLSIKTSKICKSHSLAAVGATDVDAGGVGSG